MSYGKYRETERLEAEKAHAEARAKGRRVLEGLPSWLREEFPETRSLPEMVFDRLVLRAWSAWFRFGRLDRELVAPLIGGGS